jgi:HK97 gp10 family phage protein
LQSSVSIEGIEEVLKNFKKYGEKVKQANKTTAERGSQVILEEIWDNIGKGSPYPEWITGELENSMEAKIDGIGKTFAVAHIGTLSATKEQAIIANSVEYGHAFPGLGRDSIGKWQWTSDREGGEDRVKAYPFARPAIKSSNRKVNKIYKEELQKIFGSDNEGD